MLKLLRSCWYHSLHLHLELFYHHYYTWQLNYYLYILGSPSKLLYPHMLFIFDGLLGTCFFLYPQYHSVGVCLLIYTLYSGLMCPSIDLTRYEVYIFSKEASSQTDVSRRHWDYTQVSSMNCLLWNRSLLKFHQCVKI